MNTQAIIEEAQRILLEAQVEAVRVVSAFELSKPVERPSGTWLVARERAEQRHGTKLIKFYD